MPDRRTPFDLAGEKETLLEFLDYLRESIILKVEDLDEEAARRSTVPSGTSLLGLVKHLTVVELTWFQLALAGIDTPFPAEAIGPSDTVASVLDAYRATVTANNAIVDAYNDLDRLCARALRTPEPLSLRWLLVHMVEETARHAGHAGHPARANRRSNGPIDAPTTGIPQCHRVDGTLSTDRLDPCSRPASCP